MAPEDPVITPRFRLYRICPCEDCNGIGKVYAIKWKRCADCRGEGRVRQLVAECDTPADVGVAIVTLGREGEWSECPFGLLDTEGEIGEKWLVIPWLPSPRNASDAGKLLRSLQAKGAR